MRTSTAQLKLLLEALSTPGITDHPLMAMYQAMLKNALLDLRDHIGDVAVLQRCDTFTGEQLDQALREIQGPTPKDDTDWRDLRYRLSHFLNEARYPSRRIDYDKVRAEAIAPMVKGK